MRASRNFRVIAALGLKNTAFRQYLHPKEPLKSWLGHS